MSHLRHEDKGDRTRWDDRHETRRHGTEENTRRLARRKKHETQDETEMDWRLRTFCGDVVMCFVFVYMVFHIVVSYRCREGNRQRERNFPI